MKITNNPPPPSSGSSGTGRTNGAGRQNATQGSGAASPNDPTARLTQLEAQVAPSDFSAAKVNEISAAINAGNYQVNAGVIADKLLQSTAELARKPAAAS